MKTPNLYSVQQKYITERERSIQKTLKILPFLPLILALILFVPALGNPKAVGSSAFMSAFLLLLSILSFCVIAQTQRKYLKRLTAEQLERIERDCLHAFQYEGLMVTRDAVMYFMPAILALSVRELVWIYPLTEIHKKGLLMRKTYYVVCAVTRDKRRYILLRENLSRERMDASMQFLQEALSKLRPGIIIGYSKQLEDLRDSDFSRLVRIAEQGATAEDSALLPQSIHEPCLREIIHP